MTPPTVNAYYNPSWNEMVFPAGIMQHPFFDAKNPVPMNYGAIGMAMGHELTHGFDDQGRKFDGTGKLTQWWEDGVVAKFEERARCVEELYAGYEVQPGLHRTEADARREHRRPGRDQQAYRAWRAWVARHGEPKPAVPAPRTTSLLRPFAQACTPHPRDPARVLVTADGHSTRASA
jgi:hypothetical protein